MSGDDGFEIDLGVVSFPKMKVGIQDKHGKVVKIVETTTMQAFLALESQYVGKGYQEVHQDKRTSIMNVDIMFVPEKVVH